MDDATSEWEKASVRTSSTPSTPRQLLYHVRSPSRIDGFRGSTDFTSLPSSPHYYHSSSLHNSTQPSTPRFSLPFSANPSPHAWEKLSRSTDHEHFTPPDDFSNQRRRDCGHSTVCYASSFILSFAVLFTAFCLVIWAASFSYTPEIIAHKIVFHNLFIQSGTDNSGVPTDMMSINSTMETVYRNPATFFGLHVAFTRLDLCYYQLKVASGEVRGFYQPRKSQRRIEAVIQGRQVPLYGGGLDSVLEFHLNLTFAIRSTAHVLGTLVKRRFHETQTCSVTMLSAQLGKPYNLIHSCSHG